MKFCENNLVSQISILNEDIWWEDYVSARVGHWHLAAVDRSRFHARIDRVNESIGWVFDDAHRNRVYDSLK